MHWSKLAVSCLFAPLPAQVAWQAFPAYSAMPSLNSYGIVHDEQRGRTVLFGGYVLPSGTAQNETWEWDGSSWQRRMPANSPPAMHVSGMVYDAARQVVVLCDAAMQPWEYDGVTWSPRPVAVTPPPRFGYGFCYDRARGRTVLFGGTPPPNPFGALQDTWEWDGQQWTTFAPAVMPSARTYPSMAFDPVRQRTLLLGGGVPGPMGGISYYDQWEWDGTTWTQVALAAPAGFPFGGFTTTHLQRNRVMLYGNTWGTNPFLHWEWDGTNWSSVQSPQGPMRPTGAAPPYDVARNRVVWFGSYDLGSLANVAGMTGVFEWDTITWQLIGAVQPARPATRFGHGFAHFAPSQTTVMFGGSNGAMFTDTWEWNGNSWAQRQPATSPPARYTTRMAAQPSRGEIVLFGGQGLGGFGLGDTWVWNGNTWAQRAPATSPPARYGHAMACDTLRDRVVLFGGTVGFSAADTTYEWDGVTWTQRLFAVRPPTRTAANMAFDSARGRTVLFGGLSRGDTWEYDGTTWVQRLPANNPPVGWPMLAYDEARARTVLFGNDGQAWEWDGGNWTQRITTPAPPGRSDGGLAYDAQRARIVLFSGINSGTKDDIWEYGPTTPAQWSTFGNGCAGTLGIPSLDRAPGSLPWLGSPFELRIGGIPTGQSAITALGSRTQWGSMPLPLSLANFGMPGCTLLAGGDDLRFVPAVGGSGALSLPIPNAPWALGVTIDAQAAVLDPGANTAGLVMTPAGTMTIGGR